jgi:nucleoside-diphosphate-sugar epimerase
LLDGLVRLMNADDLHEPVNLGNQGEFTIEELAVEVARLCGTSANLKREPLPADDPRQRKPDTTRARELLGWEPKVGLREGLERTIEHFRNRVSAVASVEMASQAR